MVPHIDSCVLNYNAAGTTRIYYSLFGVFVRCLAQSLSKVKVGTILIGTQGLIHYLQKAHASNNRFFFFENIGLRMGRRAGGKAAERLKSNHMSHVQYSEQVAMRTCRICSLGYFGNLIAKA